MNKKNEPPAIVIESGKPIEIKATNRDEAAKKLSELRKQAEADGLAPSEGGFIQHREGEFFAVITFIKL